MIVISAVLVVVGAALLIAGLVANGLTLIYVSLGVTVAAALLLVLGVRGLGRRPAAAGADVPAGAAQTQSLPAFVAEPSRDRAASTEPATAVESADDSAGTVVVVSGRPRYHVAGCRFLTGREEAEDITVEEARELGFTPCGACKPDDHLAGVPAAASPPPGASEAEGVTVLDGARGAQATTAELERPVGRRAPTRRAAGPAGTDARAAGRPATAAKSAPPATVAAAAPAARKAGAKATAATRVTAAKKAPAATKAPAAKAPAATRVTAAKKAPAATKAPAAKATAAKKASAAKAPASKKSAARKASDGGR